MRGDKDVDWVGFERGSSVCMCVCVWVVVVEKIVSYIARMPLSLEVMSLSLLSSQLWPLPVGLGLSHSLLHNPSGGFSGSVM